MLRVGLRILARSNRMSRGSEMVSVGQNLPFEAGNDPSIVSNGISKFFKDTFLISASCRLENEAKTIVKQRNKIMKAARRHMKQVNSAALEVELEKLRSNVVPLDEVAYVTLIFGYLLLPKHGVPAAESVLARLDVEDFVHPALKRAIGGFVHSLKELERYDAFPNRTAILKAQLPLAEIATKVKVARLSAQASFIKKQSVAADTEGELADDDSAHELDIDTELDTSKY